MPWNFGVTSSVKTFPPWKCTGKSKYTSRPNSRLHKMCPRLEETLGESVLKPQRKNAFMMTSSNGNIFRVTAPLCGEFTGHRWIPHSKASDAELWCFLWSTPWINGWINNREAGDLIRHRAHYDVTLMWGAIITAKEPIVSEWYYDLFIWRMD